jgi:hypothetical protein
MSVSRKTFWRAMALLAAAFLLQAQFAGTLEASRDSAACVQACNGVRFQCKAECATDCAALFPPGIDRDACLSTCEDGCIEDSKECKAKCNVKKNPPSPSEP